MRVKALKASSKALGGYIFLLVLLLKGAFPNAAFAFLSSLDGCAVKPECAAAISSELAPVVATPTASAGGTISITATSAAGATTSAPPAVAGVTVVGDIRLSGIVAYHIWTKYRNGQAQNKARERYCTNYPTDLVCGFFGGQSDGVLYNISYDNDRHYFGTVSHGGGSYSTYDQPYDKFTSTTQVYGPIVGIRVNGYPGIAGTPGVPGGGYSVEVYSRGWPFGNNRRQPLQPGWYFVGNGGSPPFYDFISNFKVLGRADGLPDTSSNPPVPWKDWPQAKRSAAVASLTNSDWTGFITSMPEGGILRPGDKVNAPIIVIPGQEADDPSTPSDERLLKKQPGFFTNPGRDDFDYDADGTADSADPEPQNPSVPTASGGSSSPPSGEPLDTSQEPEPSPLSEITEGASAKNLAEAKAAELRTLPRSSRPRANAAVVDTETGTVYHNTSGQPLPTTIHPYLAARMPVPSLEDWEVANCAEFKAVNDALLNGAKIEKLEVHTVRTKDGNAFPRCDNCRLTVDGPTVTSD